MTNETIKRKLKNLPTGPGVYLHKDDKGKVLYVGKAKNLRNRVRQYFQSGPKHTPRIDLMVPKIADVDVIVTRSEVEALLVESNFIKQYRPPYNVVLRDDKHYLFAKVTTGETWPRVLTVRRTEEKDSRYFGPYTSAGKLRGSLKALRRAFPWCDVAHSLKDPLANKRPCFNYRIGLCPGACIGKVTPEAYRANIDGVMRVLDGETGEMEKRLTSEMQEAAANQRYEQAAKLRDQLDCLVSLKEGQQAVDVKGRNRDVVGMARDEGHAVVILLNVRNGRVVARKEFTFWGEGDAEDAEVIDSFLGQYYKVATNLPDEVLVPLETDNAVLVSELLAEQQGHRVPVEQPRRGGRRQLLELAQANASDFLRQLREAWMEDKERTDRALADLVNCLGLSEPPNRIECYDISNLTGTSTVASMVVFEAGVPKKSDYRRFQIKHVEGIDDFASMREVISRRFSRLAAQRESGDESFGILPDLVIIDGGKGQVSAATEALEKIGLPDISMIGLAKRLEEIIMRQPDGSFDVKLLPVDSQGLYLVQRIRDEAHRFAITYNRQMRSKRGIQSVLDQIPGIGPVKKKLLMRKFGSVSKIREADLTEIQAVVGKAAGEVVKEHL